MKLLDVIAAKRVHLARLTNQAGASGESAALAEMDNWIPRPKGVALSILLRSLLNSGVSIKGSSFDAIALPESHELDFQDERQVTAALPRMCFVEIKSANQSRVKPGFGGFFFAITEAEIAASDALGDRHKVALHNKLTGEVLMTSVPEILARAKSSNWQLSVQL